MIFKCLIMRTNVYYLVSFLLLITSPSIGQTIPPMFLPMALLVGGVLMEMHRMNLAMGIMVRSMAQR